MDLNDTVRLVDVREYPGIFAILSLESATSYIVDAREELPIAMFFRSPAGPTISSRYDRIWSPLTQLAALPVTWVGSRYLKPSEITMDVRPWTLRLGSPHIFVTPETDPVWRERNRSPYYSVTSSAAARIIRVTPEWLEDEQLI